MRNIKKLLCVALAVAMAMSLFVLPQSASAAIKDVNGYKDKADIAENRLEAIDVLTWLGILQGDAESGNFRPKDTVTRAEALKTILFLRFGPSVSELQGEAFKTNTGFKDVPKSHWASGIIARAVAEGIALGNGDGTFTPDAPITYAEYITFLLRALGYGVKGEFEGANWDLHAIQQGAAEHVNLVVPTGSSFTAGAPRQEMAQLLFTALTVSEIVTLDTTTGRYITSKQYSTGLGSSATLVATYGELNYLLKRADGVYPDGSAVPGGKFNLPQHQWVQWNNVEKRWVKVANLYLNGVLVANFNAADIYAASTTAATLSTNYGMNSYKIATGVVYNDNGLRTTAADTVSTRTYIIYNDGATDVAAGAVDKYDVYGTSSAATVAGDQIGVIRITTTDTTKSVFPLLINSGETATITSTTAYYGFTISGTTTAAATIYNDLSAGVKALIPVPTQTVANREYNPGARVFLYDNDDDGVIDEVLRVDEYLAEVLTKDPLNPTGVSIYVYTDAITKYPLGSNTIALSADSTLAAGDLLWVVVNQGPNNYSGGIQVWEYGAVDEIDTKLTGHNGSNWLAGTKSYQLSGLAYRSDNGIPDLQTDLTLYTGRYGKVLGWDNAAAAPLQYAFIAKLQTYTQPGLDLIIDTAAYVRAYIYVPGVAEGKTVDVKFDKNGNVIGLPKQDIADTVNGGTMSAYPLLNDFILNGYYTDDENLSADWFVGHWFTYTVDSSNKYTFSTLPSTAHELSSTGLETLELDRVQGYTGSSVVNPNPNYDVSGVKNKVHLTSSSVEQFNIGGKLTTKTGYESFDTTRTLNSLFTPASVRALNFKTTLVLSRGAITTPGVDITRVIHIDLTGGKTPSVNFALMTTMPTRVGDTEGYEAKALVVGADGKVTTVDSLTVNLPVPPTPIADDQIPPGGLMGMFAFGAMVRYDEDGDLVPRLAYSPTALTEITVQGATITNVGSTFIEVSFFDLNTFGWAVAHLEFTDSSILAIGNYTTYAVQQATLATLPSNFKVGEAITFDAYGIYSGGVSTGANIDFTGVVNVALIASRSDPFFGIGWAYLVDVNGLA